MPNDNETGYLQRLKSLFARPAESDQMTENTEKISVLFVCMGNICRSPTAAGAFQRVVDDAGLGDWFEIDSAGTHAYHTNEPPDHRARAAAATRGVSLEGQRARRVTEQDFERFDYILAMDEQNIRHLQEQSPDEPRSTIRLFLDYSAALAETEVPDPYYGGDSGFEDVFDICEAACRGFLDYLRREHELG